MTSAAAEAAERGETPEPLPALGRDLPEVEEAARLPRGFRVAGVRAGIKVSGLPDLALVVLDGPPAPVAATFTTNRLPAAPVQVNREHLRASHPAGDGSAGWVSAMISTSGCANAATGPAGLADQRALMAALAEATGARREHVLGMSTGLIGTRLPVDRVEAAIRETVAGGLAADDDHWAAVADALRTTDSRPKSASVRIELPGPDRRPVPVTVSGVAKGVGMIHPSMATMLSFVLTDAAAEPDDLIGTPAPHRRADLGPDQRRRRPVHERHRAARRVGRLGRRPRRRRASVRPRSLGAAIEAVARSLARQQASDGEGATTLITCAVSGAEDDADARAVARAVVSSSLVKAAVHGADPNWGRIAAAAGNATLASEEVLVAGGPTRGRGARAGGTARSASSRRGCASTSAACRCSRARPFPSTRRRSRRR